jgi:hypothetical protein
VGAGLQARPSCAEREARWKPLTFSRGSGAFRRREKVARHSKGFSLGKPPKKERAQKGPPAIHSGFWMPALAQLEVNHQPLLFQAHGTSDQPSAIGPQGESTWSGLATLLRRHGKGGSNWAGLILGSHENGYHAPRSSRRRHGFDGYRVVSRRKKRGPKACTLGKRERAPHDFLGQHRAGGPAHQEHSRQQNFFDRRTERQRFLRPHHFVPSFLFDFARTGTLRPRASSLLLQTAIYVSDREVRGSIQPVTIRLAKNFRVLLVSQCRTSRTCSLHR